MDSGTRVKAEIFINFLLGSERTRARGQATAVEVKILCIITAIITELFASIGLSGERGITSGETTAVPIKELGG